MTDAPQPWHGKSLFACLVCPCCGRECRRLHGWAYCDSCWYGYAGGDLASDQALVEGVTVRLA